MKLLIDDKRWDNPAIYDIPVCDMTIRNAEFALEFLHWLYSKDTIAFAKLEIYLDHDMGEEKDIAIGHFDTYKSNGYGILCLIEAMIHDSGYYPKSITLVTDNASAAVQMMAMLKKYYPHKRGWSFSREPFDELQQNT